MNDFEYNEKKAQFQKLTSYDADENVVAYLTYLNILKLEEIKKEIYDYILSKR